ncbi:MAG: type II toxin-antitoxin system RelE/ParE family toxin [Acidobacteriota bacterium]|nr:MAG: type II toxin-antitoxin system RelE/ParE family toxin [Acidobacteriota bacterium]
MFLGTEDLDAGLRFLNAIEESFLHISLHPHSAPSKDLGLGEIRRFRMFPVKGFKSYLVFYRIGGDSVEIVRVLHGARDRPRHLV